MASTLNKSTQTTKPCPNSNSLMPDMSIVSAWSIVKNENTPRKHGTGPMNRAHITRRPFSRRSSARLPTGGGGSPSERVLNRWPITWNPLVDRQTYTTKKITFQQLRWRVVEISQGKDDHLALVFPYPWLDSRSATDRDFLHGYLIVR